MTIVGHVIKLPFMGNFMGFLQLFINLIIYEIFNCFY